MKRTTIWYAWVGIVILALALAAALVPAAPAHATAYSRTISPDTLSLKILSGATSQFDANPGPSLNATLVLGTLWTGLNTVVPVNFVVDGGAQSVSESVWLSDPNVVNGVYNVPVYFNSDLTITLGVGTHSVTANFTDPRNNVMVTSSAVTLIVNPIRSSLMCGVGSDGSNINTLATWAPGQKVSIAMQGSNENGLYPFDWTKGTATITLKGPKTVIYSNLPLNSSAAVIITAPTTVGRYEMNCAVTGVPDYAFYDSGFSSPSYLVSAGNELGAVKLYTNPSTLVTGVPIQMYIVFVAAPGVPTPTGQFTVYIGSGSQFLYLRNGAYIGSGGTTLISLSPISNLYSAKSITINYFGDPYYKPQEWTFPITNPNIPGSSGGTAPKKPTATPKPHATATVSVTATVDTGSGATSIPPAATPGARPSVLGAFGPFSGGGLIALLIVVALLALGGGVGTFVLLSRRGAVSTPSSGYPPQWPARSPLDVDTAPNLDTTRPDAPPWWRQDDGPYSGQG